MKTDFLTELNLYGLIKIRENSWNGKNYIELEKMLTDDINVINYRLDALGDLMADEKLTEGIRSILPQLYTLREARSVDSGESDGIDNLYAVHDLQIYVRLVDELGNMLNAAELNSEMFRKLCLGIDEIVTDEAFIKLKEAIPENARLVSDIKSVTLGINLDTGLHPAEAGIISVNNRRFVSGSIIDKVLRIDAEEDSFRCAAPLSMPGNLLAGRNERDNFEMTINNALYKLIRSSIKSWKPAVKIYTAAKTNFIISFYNDLRFLTAAADFYRKLKEMRYPVCRPIVREKSARKTVLKGMYFPQLVLDGVNMTLNDFECDDKGALFMLSGANSGGKTIYGKAVAVCQALFQLGLYVPSEYAELSPVDEILLHFASSGKSITQSRFTEECEKMSALMHSASEFSLVVCDEPFSGTSAYEAAAISEEVIKAMSAKGCRGVYISHIHELSGLADKINGTEISRSRIDNLTVKIDHTDGKRLYKVIRERTSGLSYASDIAEKYGLSYDKLMQT